MSSTISVKEVHTTVDRTPNKEKELRRWKEKAGKIHRDKPWIVARHPPYEAPETF
jgi:hypothetical protein